MTGEERFELPDHIKAHFKAFMAKAKEDLPQKSIFKEMGVPNVSIENLYTTIMTIFNL